MQIQYFTYHIEPFGGTDAKKGKQRLLVDLSEFFRKFAAQKAPKWKRQFSYNGELVLLVPHAGNVLLFVQARDREIIKTIEKSTYSVDAIQKILANSSVAFGSYLVLGQWTIGFAAKVLSPRVKAFSLFVNEVFRALNMNYTFHMQAVQTHLPKSEANKIQSSSKFSLRINSKNSLFDDITSQLFAGDDHQEHDIGSIEIVIRPLGRKGNTRTALTSLASTISEKGVEEFRARARTEMVDHVTDVYLVGAGTASDLIVAKSERGLADLLSAAESKNVALSKRRAELEDDDNFKKMATSDLPAFDWKSAWAGRLAVSED